MKSEQMSKKFNIAFTWDGKILASHDQTTVAVSWLANGDLAIEVDAPFANDPKPVCEKTACWELWNYEVVELFLVGEGDPAPYIEIEISPWGYHLVLQLLGERNIIAQELPLEIVNLKRTAARWKAKAVIAAQLIPDGDLKVNAYRISGEEPERHYHVMTPMKSSEPDFHCIEQFTERLTR